MRKGKDAKQAGWNKQRVLRVESAWVGWRRCGGEQLGKRQVRDGRQAEEKRGHEGRRKMEV